MRRARIKAVATVPVRRKTAQDGLATEHVGQTDNKVHEKSLEGKINYNIESSPPETKQTEVEKIITHEAREKQTCVNEKDFLETKIQQIKSKTKNDEQNTLKIECQQKPLTALIEGSPIKAIQNRSCFMRPTPRLDGGGRVRRNSIQGSGASASESEDDSRRSNLIIQNRVRNDSVCSIQSLKDSGNVNSIAKLNLGQKRRMVVSESARKLTEARREFLLKHENKSPDKSKLTMYDLIYYNPTSNPMKPKSTTIRPNNRKISVCSIPDKKKEEEEAVDEPSEMLVPQVKVGPNGQLIIDEQSLVIDQYKVQESIDRSDIIVDEDTTGNGFYKRRKKSKEWNKWETVKFYKALNTYGTDFLLMQSIFPTRTRQELKLKYKKEERLNRSLVEKALQYQEFDTETLEKDLASVEENERKESELNKVKKDTNLPIKRKRKRCQLIAREINCENDDNSEYNKNTCEEQSSDEDARITITKKIRKRTVRKRKTIKSDIPIYNEEFKDNSDSELEVYRVQPTRSGRTSRKTRKIPKSINIFDIESEKINEEIGQVDDRYNNNKEENKEIEIRDSQNIENNEVLINLHKIENNEMMSEVDQINQIIEMQNEEENENQNELLEILGANSNISANIFDGITDDIPNVTNLKPGSLVVLKKNCNNEPGKTSLQIYIVSADYNVNNPNSKDGLLPIDLSPDILETVTNCIKDIEPQNVEQEYNVP